MQNYKEMYLKMFRTVEKAIEMLIEVQRECEEIYVTSDLKSGTASCDADDNTTDED